MACRMMVFISFIGRLQVGGWWLVVGGWVQSRVQVQK